MENVHCSSVPAVVAPQSTPNFPQISNRSAVLYHASNENIAAFLLTQPNSSNPEIKNLSRVLYYTSVEDFTILVPQPSTNTFQVTNTNTPSSLGPQLHSEYCGCGEDTLLSLIYIVLTAIFMFILLIYWLVIS